MRKLFKGGNYSKEETICGNTVVKKKTPLIIQKCKKIKNSNSISLEFIFSKKATKIDKIFTVGLTFTT